MAITKINNVLVKHGRLMFAVITAVIIVAFVWFFTPGASGSILFDRNPTSPNAVVGEVFGTPVKNKDVTHALSSFALVQGMLYNTEPNVESSNVPYDQAFMLASAAAVAKHLGVVVPDTEVVKMIRDAAAFKKDGKFSADAYIAYEKEKLQPAGFNAADLEEAVRYQLTVSSLSTMIGEPVVPQAELDEFIRTNLEKYDVLSIVCRTEDFKKAVNATPEDLQSFFNSNKKLFMIPEKFTAEAVVFKYSAYAAKAVPSAKEIRDYYNANKQSFMKGGKQQTLAEVTAVITATLKQKKMHDAAMADAVAFREKIYQATANIAGNREAYLAEYRKVAAEYPSRVQIGWFSASDHDLPGVGHEDELSAALAAQSKSNVPVTDPVAGLAGVYVAAINGNQPEKEPEFASVTEKVKEKYVEQKASAKANEAMRTFAAAAAGVKNADASKIKELAKDAVVKHCDPFSLYPGTDKVAPEVVMLASSTDTGKLSEAVPVKDGYQAVFVLKRTAPAEKDIIANKAMLAMYYNYAKMNAVSTSLYDWIGRNTKSFIAKDQQ